MTSHQVNVVRWQHGSFEYFFDDYTSLESRGLVPYASDIEARLIGVLGCSSPKTTHRDDYRLKGWIGPTEKVFGTGRDKGHYIAHTIGGNAHESCCVARDLQPTPDRSMIIRYWMSISNNKRDWEWAHDRQSCCKARWTC